MNSPLPPDPYAALGVPKTADVQTIKATYRKLVLKCHPDKFPDESLKAQKQEEFQKIQQAYELIGDEEARSRYDAQVRLAELRREGLERQRRGSDGPRVEVRTGYKVRTAEPSAAFYSRSTANATNTATPDATSASKPRSYDESDRLFEEQRASSRKYDGYESFSRRSPRVEREDKSRGEKKKSREKDERRERSTKYSTYVVDDDDSDDRARYEASYRRRNEDERLREELKRKAEEARKVVDRQREAEEKSRKARREADYASEGYERKMREKADEARDYIERSRVGSHDDGRPSMARMNSGSSSQFYEIRGGKPVEVRRSRASKERRSSRDRRYPEIVEPQRPPTLEKSHSTPANIKVTRVSPHRSQDYESHSPPRLHRSETDPVRRKDAAPQQPSKLRESIPVDSGYSSPSSPEAQYPGQPTPKSSTKMYRYTTVPMPSAPEEYDFSGGHRTVLREPERYRARSPSPLSRDHKHERVIPTVSPRTTPLTSGVRYTATTIPRPPIPHANSSARVEDLHSERERGRDRSSRPLYGETTHTSSYRRGDKPSGGSYKMDDVNFAPRYGKDDVQFSRGYNAGFEAAKRQLYSERSWDEERPRVGRSATTVY